MHFSFPTLEEEETVHRDKAPHPRTPKSSATMLQEPQTSLQPRKSFK